MFRCTRKQLTLAIVGVALVLIPFARRESAQSTSRRTPDDTGTTNSRRIARRVSTTAGWASSAWRAWPA
jgi:hypothetical protein